MPTATTAATNAASGVIEETEPTAVQSSTTAQWSRPWGPLQFVILAIDEAGLGILVVIVSADPA